LQRRECDVFADSAISEHGNISTAWFGRAKQREA
jgi:hypothetical protein